MLSINFTFLFVLLNFLVLYLFMRLFLFKRVGDVMDNRTRQVEDDMAAGRRYLTEGDEMRKKYEDALTAARGECGALVEDARRRAQGEYDIILSDARREAAAVIQTARERMAAERDEMLRSLGVEFSDLVVEAASKVVEANMDTVRNRTLIEEYLSGRTYTGEAAGDRGVA